MKLIPNIARSRHPSSLIKIGSLLSFFTLFCLPFDSALGQPAETASISAAQVEAWLALTDNGEYAKSWETAAQSFQKAVTKDQWVTMVENVRKPLGELISRKVRTAKQTKKLPGMPSGSYYVAQFDTSFAELKEAAETVTFTLESAGEWKAAGYLILPRKTERQTAASTICPAAGDEAVTKILKPIQQKSGVPAIAAAVVTSDGIQFSGAVGVRKRGTEVPITITDLWHLGSDSKAMTSTLIGRLVERGQLNWDTTLAQVFPDLAAQMHPDFKSVTLLQLLSHRSGLPPNLKLADYRGDDVKTLRLRAAREELAKKPQHTPGSTYTYSNLGYIIAGAVIEKTTGQSWEQFIRSELFEPLKMKTAGFGGTGTRGEIDQPWPHTANGKPTIENGPDMDNLPVMGPAGRVHCSIQDWALFIQDQLRGERGEKALLKPETYKKLHTPPFGGDYALGWMSLQRSWGGGKVLNHAGDNTMNFANVWIAPKRDFAILACVNQSGDTAFGATDEAVVALMKLTKEKP